MSWPANRSNGPVLTGDDRLSMLGALPPAAWALAGVPAGVPLSPDGRRSVAQTLWELGFKGEARKVVAGRRLPPLTPPDRKNFCRRVGEAMS